jgi:hypothetical protein
VDYLEAAPYPSSNTSLSSKSSNISILNSIPSFDSKTKSKKVPTPSKGDRSSGGHSGLANLKGKLEFLTPEKPVHKKTIKVGSGGKMISASVLAKDLRKGSQSEANSMENGTL